MKLVAGIMLAVLVAEGVVSFTIFNHDTELSRDWTLYKVRVVIMSRGNNESSVSKCKGGRLFLSLT